MVESLIRDRNLSSIEVFLQKSVTNLGDCPNLGDLNSQKSD
jgi:hypothetical protein